jgi:hypothetical protein
MARPRNLQNANKPQLVTGYLVEADDAYDATHTYFLLTALDRLLLLRLLNYGRSVSAKVLASATLDTLAEGWTPARISFFIEPSSFVRDKTDCLWCLLSKADALALHREWLEDERYSAAIKEGASNYYKNQVDEFKHILERRKW